jgi:hypothetical protein
VRRRQFLSLAGVSVPLWALTLLDEALIRLPEPPGPVSASSVANSLRTCRALYGKARHADLVTSLPELLTTAHQLAESTGTPQAWATLASCYELATHTLSKLGSHESSRLAADRAVIYARLAQSPVATALATVR